MKIWLAVAALFAVLLSTTFAHAQTPLDADDCDPPCRAGYYCKDGDCVEKCNPPCPEGMRCTDSGDCVPVQNYNPGNNNTTVDPSKGPLPDEGWSLNATYMGYGTAGAVLLGAVLAAATSEDEEISIPIGIVTTLLGGAMIPVVSVGAASARHNPAVIGQPGFRLAGWIGYGFAMANAVIIIGLSFAAYIPPSLSISVGVLGAAAAIFMALDAKMSYDQAIDLKQKMGITSNQRLRVRPIASVVPDPYYPGKVRAFAGVVGTF